MYQTNTINEMMTLAITIIIIVPTVEKDKIKVDLKSSFESRHLSRHKIKVVFIQEQRSFRCIRQTP